MPYLTGNTIPVTNRCKVIRIPDDLAFLDALNGQLFELTLPENWETFGSVTAQQMADAFSAVYDPYTTEACVEVTDFPYPKIVHISLLQGQLLQGTNLVYTVASGQLFNGGIEVTPTAQFNAIRYPVWCEAGEYDVAVLGIESTNYGIVTAQSVGGTLANTKDWYAAAGTSNVVQTYRVDFPARGLNYVDFRAGSKRAASTGYRFIFSDIVMTWLHA